MALVLLEKKNHIGYVTMNRPEALNALNVDVLDELDKVLDQITADSDIWVVIVTGAGRSFVAGADIAYMVNASALEGRDFSLKGNAVFTKLENLAKPVIAAINGFALGGGCELAAACDIRIASTKAKFGLPETGLGIMPGFGGTQRVPRIVGAAKAKELIWTAETIKAEEAERIGLVSYVVEPEELMAKAEEIAGKICNNAQVSILMSKRVINRGLQVDIDSGIVYEVEGGTVLFGTEDKQEAMAAFVEKRPHAPFKNK